MIINIQERNFLLNISDIYLREFVQSFDTNTLHLLKTIIKFANET